MALSDVTNNEFFVKVRHATHPNKDVPCLDVAVIRRIPATRKRMATTEVVWASEPHQTRGGLKWGPLFQKQIEFAVNMAAGLEKKHAKRPPK
jgi:hypothetical protein